MLIHVPFRVWNFSVLLRSGFLVHFSTFLLAPVLQKAEGLALFARFVFELSTIGAKIPAVSRPTCCTCRVPVWEWSVLDWPP